MTETPMKELVFVYNADSGVFNRVTDFAHKFISPDTYACNLCSLTFGSLKMHHRWADFVGGIGHKVTFIYKDQFKSQTIDNPPPLVLLKEGNQTRVILDAAKLNEMRSLDELIGTLKEKL